MPRSPFVPNVAAPRYRRAAGRALTAAVLAAALAGCSVVGLAYNRLPTLLTWRLDRLWHLDAAQREDVHAAAQRWLDWHRREQLPVLAEWLQRWQDLAQAAAADADTVCREADGLRAWLRQATERSSAELARILATLSDAQLAHWRARLSEADTEWQRDWGQADIDRGMRLTRTRERLEMFYGRLDDEQRRWLRARLKEAEYRPDLAWALRQQRHADWLETARRLRGLSAQAAADEVRALWQRTWRSPDPTLAAYQERVWRQACTMLAQWHGRASPEQRRRAVAQWQAYARDVQALMPISDARIAGPMRLGTSVTPDDTPH